MRKDKITSILYGVRTYNNHLVCEKCFNSDLSNPIRKKMSEKLCEYGKQQLFESDKK